MYEILDTPYAYRGTFNPEDETDSWGSEKRDEANCTVVRYSPISDEWRISNKDYISVHDIKANVEFGKGRINAYHIIEQTLNLRVVTIKDEKEIDGKSVRILNEEETTLARQKQSELMAAFEDWLFKDPERRQKLVTIYNEKFNSIRPRQYDGSHISFAGMNTEIKLDPHQVNAVARGLYGGNTLLGHEVGAGKSFTMAAIAMESKRLGLCSKPPKTYPRLNYERK